MATILVLVDRATNRDVLVTLLGYAGHTALEAQNAEVALELVREGVEQVVHLVVRQRQAPIPVGGFQRRTALTQYVHALQRLGVLLVEQMASAFQVHQHRQDHPQEHRGNQDELLILELVRDRRSGRDGCKQRGNQERTVEPCYAASKTREH